MRKRGVRTEEPPATGHQRGERIGDGVREKKNGRRKQSRFCADKSWRKKWRGGKRPSDGGAIGHSVSKPVQTEKRRGSKVNERKKHNDAPI